MGQIGGLRLLGAAIRIVALLGDAVALEAGQDSSAGGFSGMVSVHVDRVIKDGDSSRSTRIVTARRRGPRVS